MNFYESLYIQISEIQVTFSKFSCVLNHDIYQHTHLKIAVSIRLIPKMTGENISSHLQVSTLQQKKMPRPKTGSDEKRMKMNAKEKIKTTTDPVERLRLACMARGTQGIKSLGR